MSKHSATNLLFATALLLFIFLYQRGLSAPLWLTVPVLLYPLIIFCGAYFIGLNFFIASKCHGPRSKAQIAISFDDGPNEHTAAMLDLLKTAGVPAAFFCIGAQIKGREELLRRIDAEGHTIGTHSMNHRWHFALRPVSKIALDIAQSQDLVHSVIGKRPILFRPPFGVTDPLLAKAIGQTAVHSIGWSLRSYDTVLKDKNKLLKRLKKIRNGDVVLFHEAGLQTNVILPLFIKYVQSKGMEIVPLQDVLSVKPYQ